MGDVRVTVFGEDGGKIAGWTTTEQGEHILEPDVMARDHFYSSHLGDMQQQALDLAHRWFSRLQRRGKGAEAVHFAMGASGEAGEVLEIVKKANRKCDSEEEVFAALMDPKVRDKIKAECADVLSYLMDMAELLQFDLGEEWANKMFKNEERWQGGDWGDPAP